MDVTSILKDAAKAASDAGVPDELKPIAFEKAVDLLSRSPASLETPREHYASPETGGNAPDSTEPHDLLGRIAKKLRAEIEVVQEVFGEKNGDLEIIVQGSKLASSKMQATKELALIVVAGRIAAGLVEEVTSDEIRKVADDHGKYDEGNFAKAIGEMDDAFVIGGTPRKRVMRLRRPGWDQASSLVNKLGGGGTA